MRQKPPNTPYVLDKFSAEDLAAWERREEAIQEYMFRLFYHLEGLRNYHQSDLYKALKDSETISIRDDKWCRIVDYKYSDNPLSAKGSILQGKRFNIGNDLENFPSFAALYVGEDSDTAHKERFGIPKVSNGLSADELALRKPTSYGFVNLNVNLGSVFDLTKASNLKKFSDIISKFRLTPELKELAKKAGEQQRLIKKASELKNSLLDPDWKLSPTQYDLPSNSQIFGRFLNAAGFAGVIYPSVRATGKKCIAIFGQNFNDTDFVELSDAAPVGVKYLRVAADNWKQVIA